MNTACLAAMQQVLDGKSPAGKSAAQPVSTTQSRRSAEAGAKDAAQRQLQDRAAASAAHSGGSSSSPTTYPPTFKQLNHAQRSSALRLFQQVQGVIRSTAAHMLSLPHCSAAWAPGAAAGAAEQQGGARPQVFSMANVCQAALQVRRALETTSTLLTGSAKQLCCYLCCCVDMADTDQPLRGMLRCRARCVTWTTSCPA